MKDDPLPSSNHISRYCRFTAISEDGRRVEATAFLLGDTDEYLSVNWLENLNLPSRDQEIEEIREILATKLTLGKQAKIAVLNVGSTQDHVQIESGENRYLRILHRPDEPAGKIDPSHSGIFDTANDEEMRIAELIAEKIAEIHPAVEK